MSGALHLLGTVEGQLVALELEPVAEVLPMLAVDRVPGGPPALVGFANLRGEPVPVLRLRTLFGYPAPELDVSERIVICVVQGRALGLVLDDVTSLGRPTALRAPSVEDHLVATEVVRGVGVVDGRVCVVVDPRIAADWLTRTLNVPALPDGTTASPADAGGEPS